MAARTPSRWPGADGVARRTHPLTVASVVVSTVAALLGVSLVALGSAASPSSRDGVSGPVLLLGVLVVLLTGGTQVARWFVTTYTVLPTELVVDQGLLTRDHRVLPYARVQQADTHQSLVGQIFGLTELRIDSAGSAGATQVRLRLLDDATARALRDYVLARRAAIQAQQVAAADPAGPPGDAPAAGAGAGGEVPVLRLGVARLLLAAATHSSLVVAIPAAAVVALWAAAFAAMGSSTRTGGLVALGVLPAVLLVVGALFVAQLVNHVMGLYGFSVSVAGDDVHLRYGLFETRNLTVPRRRVQQITITDNPLRRALGLVELSLHSAAAPGGRAGDTTRFTVPVLRRADVDHVVTRLMGSDAWAVPPLLPRPDAARRRALVRRCLAVAAAVALPAVVLRPGGWALLGLVLVGIPWGMAAHRRAGHGVSSSAVALSHGVLHHRIDVVPLARVQSCRTEQNPMQRLSAVTTAWIDVAGARMPPHLWDMDATTAAELLRTLPRRGVAAAGGAGAAPR